ncbi:MAG TPA: MFS transporter [archaeon]|nr:MFS transporter [archaeon]
MHKQIKYLILINAVFVFALNMFAPLYAIFVQGITKDIVHVGGVWGFYIISVGVFTYFISKWEDKLKYADLFLLLGFALRALGWGGYLVAATLGHVYLIQLVLALGEAFGTPAYNAMFAKYLDKGRFASEYGLQTSIHSFVIGGASVIGALIVSEYGFKALFALMIAFSGASTLAAYKYRGLLGFREKAKP